MGNAAAVIVTIEPDGMRQVHADHGGRPVADAELEVMLVGHAEATAEPPMRPTTGWRAWARRGFTSALVETIHALHDEGIPTSCAIKALTPLIEWGKRSFGSREDRARPRA